MQTECLTAFVVTVVEHIGEALLEMVQQQFQQTGQVRQAEILNGRVVEQQNVEHIQGPGALGQQTGLQAHKDPPWIGGADVRFAQAFPPVEQRGDGLDAVRGEHDVTLDGRTGRMEWSYLLFGLLRR